MTPPSSAPPSPAPQAQPRQAPPRRSPSPGALTAQALLNCLAREVCGPQGQAREEAGYLVLRLPQAGTVLRARLSRPSTGLAPRLSGDAELRRRRRWEPLGWRRLADLVAAEMTLATGAVNPEFTAQVHSSHAATSAIMRARASAPQPAPVGSPAERYVASEQSLVAGHRFHPAPKARQGSPAGWLRYAPEAGARFPLRFLAVRDDAAAGAGDTAALDRLGGPEPPAGYRLLPAHPWQFRLQAAGPGGWLRRALNAGLVLDLGEGDRLVAATSSVRTVYDPAADIFCKFSLGVRITTACAPAPGTSWTGR